MGMSRKDVIIVACLLNVALFMILFATATVWVESESVNPQAPVHETVAIADDMPLPTIENVPEQRAPIDEIDEVVQEYTKRRDVIAVKPEPQTVAKKEVVAEVVVKKGDVLSKIAKSHGMSVEEIMRINSLTTSKLKIGQILKVKKTQTDGRAESKPSQLPQQDAAGYYTVKGGDNPWKIARKCKIGYEELLRLNGLDEEKAKNLKVGQKLRIR